MLANDGQGKTCSNKLAGAVMSLPAAQFRWLTIPNLGSFEFAMHTQPSNLDFCNDDGGDLLHTYALENASASSYCSKQRQRVCNVLLYTRYSITQYCNGTNPNPRSCGLLSTRLLLRKPVFTTTVHALHHPRIALMHLLIARVAPSPRSRSRRILFLRRSRRALVVMRILCPLRGTGINECLRS